MHVAALMQMKTIGYLCIYRHIYRRLGGNNRRRRPPIGKSVSVSFRVRVVRASERARRSCVGV